MRTVQVYIEGQRLDLFEDEQINVTSTQQNVQDISKVFTDFSQSFNVPASPNNNAIFNHFYQNDVSQTIDSNIRRNANIEIDLTPFRTGKISLEKAEVKNNQAHSYQITFYGDLLSLKDKFGENHLSELTELSSTEFEYTGDNVLDRIKDESTDFKVRFPLIVGRNITYGNGGSTDINPSTGVGAIHYEELFPAVAVHTIFSAIETEFDITFNGVFLLEDRFKKAFLLCQNANTFEFSTAPQLAQIEFVQNGNGNNDNVTSASAYFNETQDTITLRQQNFPNEDGFVLNPFPNPPSLGFGEVGTFSSFTHRLLINIYDTSNDGVEYYIDVFMNGQFIQTLTGSGTDDYSIYAGNMTFELRKYQFYYRAQSSLSFKYFIRYEQRATYTKYNSFGIPSTTELQNNYSCGGNGSSAQRSQFSTTAILSVLNYIPQMKIVDFFKGILQMFNLTCYATEKDIYQIEPLNDWYSKGALVDITEYTDIKSTKIDRVKLFKNIELKYQESESATNTGFRELTGGRNYGDTSENFEYDGGDFKIELPFENMMMQKFTGTNLQIGETINVDLQKYTPKPLIMYQYNAQSASYNFNKGIHTNQSTYIPFGQDLKVNAEDFTLNFNADISTFLLTTVQKTLYAVYYFPYLSNLFNLKNRRTTVKTNLPISLLTNLALNDRVIIRDKRYMIESINSEITTGDVQLVLINDFQDVISDAVNTDVMPIADNTAQCIKMPILFPNNVVSAAITTTATGVTITPSALTSEGTTIVCIPANTNSVNLISSEDGNNIVTQDYLRLRTEEGGSNFIVITTTYTYADGSTTQINTIIEQE